MSAHRVGGGRGRDARDARSRRRSSSRSPTFGHVVSGLFFFPRGGSAEVVRALARSLPACGWQVTVAAGSHGGAGDPGDARGFFHGLDLVTVEYDQTLGHDRLPFPPSYEDKPGAPDQVFALIDDREFERLVAAWVQALAAAGAASAQLLHLHHLTPLNEAASRAFPGVPVVGQLHGTELAFLRAIEAGAPAHWRFAERWAGRLQAWAAACERLIVPPAAADEAARMLRLKPQRLVESTSGVDLELFLRRPLDREHRLAHWRRWLVDEPLGWDETGRPGSVRYREHDLWPFRDAEAVVLYVGRYTAVKRLPLLLRAHTRALGRLKRPLPLVLVGGHPGEWEGEHPLAIARAIGNDQVFLAGWRPHQLLPTAFNAADVLVLPSVGEAFGLVLVEAMACGLPAIATNSHGPAGIVDERTGWLVTPDDESALTDALVTAATGASERRQRGEHAYAHSRRRYGWPQITSRLAELYPQVANPLYLQRAAAE